LVDRISTGKGIGTNEVPFSVLNCESFYPRACCFLAEDNLVRFEYPANVCFQCVRCGLCCGDTEQKARHILLLKSDADQISAHTNQQIDAFAVKAADKAPYIYEMKKKQQDGKCIFLLSEECSIYEHRPLICRFYPIELSTNEEGAYIFKVTDECPGVCRSEFCDLGERLQPEFFDALLNLARDRFGVL
jgi:Fe-S-cluster containining protein